MFVYRSICMTIIYLYIAIGNAIGFDSHTFSDEAAWDKIMERLQLSLTTCTNNTFLLGLLPRFFLPFPFSSLLLILFFSSTSMTDSNTPSVAGQSQTQATQPESTPVANVQPQDTGNVAPLHPIFPTCWTKLSPFL
jgi:hypothetical protein